MLILFLSLLILLPIITVTSTEKEMGIDYRTDRKAIKAIFFMVKPVVFVLTCIVMIPLMNLIMDVVEEAITFDGSTGKLVLVLICAIVSAVVHVLFAILLEQRLYKKALVYNKMTPFKIALKLNIAYAVPISVLCAVFMGVMIG